MTRQDLQQSRLDDSPPSTPDQQDLGNIGRSLDTIKALTGLTTEQIREGLGARPPKTLARQAEARGVSQDDLVAAIVSDTRNRLLAALLAGHISQERADTRLAGLEANVTELVADFPAGRSGRRDMTA